MSFNEKVVLVTGASKGIGAAISIKFSTEKANVILISRDEEKLQEVAQKCKDVGGFAASESILSKNALKVFDDIMAVHLRAHVLVTHLTAPYLTETKGCIINISSIASTGICMRINSQYSTSKAGLDAFTRSIAIELAPYGV
ncbi:putative oxidoreductase SERP2049 [Papilio xuthus]|uniref:Putative oxidoreductase SERP2049 n=1 Tax=Papilio xuthus TaxID=66420 RepID=A0A194QK44_PAPXU|nr:putative oxidoreductase SERP2049 [Papilio xuthus]